MTVCLALPETEALLAALVSCTCCRGEGPELRLVHKDGRVERSGGVTEELMARWLLLPNLPKPIGEMDYAELRTTAANILNHFCSQKEGKSLSYYPRSEEPRFWRVPVAVLDLPLSLQAVQGIHGQVTSITMAEVIQWRKMKPLKVNPGDVVKLRTKTFHKSLMVFILELAQAVLKRCHQEFVDKEFEDDSMTNMKEEIDIDDGICEDTNDSPQIERKYVSPGTAHKEAVRRKNHKDEESIHFKSRNGQEDQCNDLEDKYQGSRKEAITDKADSQKYKNKESSKDEQTEYLIGDRRVLRLASGKFSCPDCSKQFTEKSSLRYHLDNTHSNKKKKCPHCGKSLTEGSLRYHISRFHSQNTFYCDQCDYNAPVAYDIKLHKESKHDDTQYICEECGKKFGLKYLLTQHIKDYHLGKVLMCDQCDYTCKGAGTAMTLHKNLKHQASQFVCVFCDFITTSSQEMDLHKGSVHAGSALSPQKSSEIKRKEREALKTYICPVCQIRKKSRQSLRLHIKGDHEGVRIKCPIEGCDFSGKQLSTVNAHKNTIHYKIRHQCDLCSHSSTTTTMLRLHKVKKHNLKAFACDKCSFKCQKVERMKHHMQVMHD